MRLFKPKIDNFPKLYIAETEEDCTVCEENGIPYIFTSLTDREILEVCLLPTLRRLFPKVNWPASAKVQPVVHVPGGKEKVGGIVGYKGEYATADIATSERTFEGVYDNYGTVEIRLGEYCGDLSHQVNIEELAKLDMLPKFIGDITSCIVDNITGSLSWTDSYNKKLGSSAIGNYRRNKMAPNLIILDVSNSIPRGISDTMIALIDTLRHRCKADLIVTGSISLWWESGEVLPTPEEIRARVLPRNESEMFECILKEHVLGRDWGNVISFGDNDTPYLPLIKSGQSTQGTTVGKVWHFHTKQAIRTGYAKWTSGLTKDEVFDTDWCSCIKKI